MIDFFLTLTHLRYELHPLGSRKDNDPMAHVKVARSSKGWHCPQCIHISSTKGNLKSHILSGRHKSYTEKPFGCQYCDRSYGTKQSLQVEIEPGSSNKNGPLNET